VAGKADHAGIISTWNLVTKGSALASRRVRREEAGSLVSTFRTGLFPQGPSARKAWSFEDQPSLGTWEGGYLGTRWCSNLAPWGPSPRGSWSSGDQFRPFAGWTARRVDLW